MAIWQMSISQKKTRSEKCEKTTGKAGIHFGRISWKCYWTLEGRRLRGKNAGNLHVWKKGRELECLLRRRLDSPLWDELCWQSRWCNWKITQIHEKQYRKENIRQNWRELWNKRPILLLRGLLNTQKGFRICGGSFKNYIKTHKMSKCKKM